MIGLTASARRIRHASVGDKQVAVTNSGTKTIINGQAATLGDVKAGMTCKADGEAAKMLDGK